jgi:hypothetical protein
MTQTGGLALLFAWLIFGALLAILAVVLLRHRPDVIEEARRSTEESRLPPADRPEDH